jgi:hypothetical protein
MSPREVEEAQSQTGQSPLLIKEKLHSPGFEANARFRRVLIHKRTDRKPASAVGGSSDTESSLPAEAPIYVAARRHHAADLSVEMLFQRA